MSRPLHELAQLSREMRQRPSLEDLLQLITERAAALLGVARVSVRLLEPAARLLAVARPRGGDLVLKHVTQVVGQVLRAGDAVVRGARSSS